MNETQLQVEIDKRREKRENSKTMLNAFQEADKASQGNGTQDTFDVEAVQREIKFYKRFCAERKEVIDDIAYSLLENGPKKQKLAQIYEEIGIELEPGS